MSPRLVVSNTAVISMLYLRPQGSSTHENQRIARGIQPAAPRPPSPPQTESAAWAAECTTTNPTLPPFVARFQLQTLTVQWLDQGVARGPWSVSPVLSAALSTSGMHPCVKANHSRELFVPIPNYIYSARRGYKIYFSVLSPVDSRWRPPDTNLRFAHGQETRGRLCDAGLQNRSPSARERGMPCAPLAWQLTLDPLVIEPAGADGDPGCRSAVASPGPYPGEHTDRRGTWTAQPRDWVSKRASCSILDVVEARAMQRTCTAPQAPARRPSNPTFV